MKLLIPILFLGLIIALGSYFASIGWGLGFATLKELGVLGTQTKEIHSPTLTTKME